MAGAQVAIRASGREHAAVAAPYRGSSVAAAAAAAPAAGSGPSGGSSSPRRHSSGGGGVRRAAWLRRLLRGAQAVAEEQPEAEACCDGEDDHLQDAEAASYDGGLQEEELSFGSLPEHLLEKVFSHLRGANRRHHFAICGVNRQWRRLGRQMFFSRPWEVAHLICHPTQLFCLSPRNVTGSRSGLLKCFVRRENGPNGRRYTFHIGKDASQPQRSRFLMAAKQGGRDEVHIFLNSRCQGPPCARLRSNMFATQYKLNLSEELQLEPTSSRQAAAAAAAGTAGAVSRPASAASAGGSGSGSSSSGRPPQPATFSRLSSWGEEAAAEAIAAAAAAQQRQQAAAAAQQQQAGVDCFAELQYQARVKGFMQPRRMRVVLPHPSLLFYDQQLPQLHRRLSEPIPAAALLAHSVSSASAEAAASSSGGGFGGQQLGGTGTAAGHGRLVSFAAASCTAPSSLAGSPEGSPQPAAPLGSSPATAAAANDTQPAGSGRLSRLLLRLRRRRQQQRLPKLLRQQKTVPVGEALQPMVLQNKAPHWNEGLRCWCLNFRGRVKLASVKNFQLVRAEDPQERVVMQFGKAEQDAFILDFNPTVLTALQAFAVVCTTFDSKFLL